MQFPGCFNNVIPIGGVILRFMLENVQGDRDKHIPCRTDSDGPWGRRKQSCGRPFIPGFRKVAARAFILDIELEVIGEQRKFE